VELFTFAVLNRGNCLGFRLRYFFFAAFFLAAFFAFFLGWPPLIVSTPILSSSFLLRLYLVQDLER